MTITVIRRVDSRRNEPEGARVARIRIRTTGPIVAVTARAPQVTVVQTNVAAAHEVEKIDPD